MIRPFIDGIMAYGKAITLISEGRLWKFILIPGFLSIILGLGIATTAWGLSDNIGNWLIGWYPFEWGRTVLQSFSWWVGGAVVITGGIIVYKHLVLVLVSPFMSPLSQKIEAQLLGHQENFKGFQMGKALQEMWRGLRIALRNILRELGLVVLLFLLGLIPIFGWAATLLIFLVQAYYAGFGNMDYTLERHFNIRQSVHFARQNRGLAMGIGTVFLLLLATGIGFLIAPPLATIAATLETSKRLPISHNTTLDELV